MTRRRPVSFLWRAAIVLVTIACAGCGGQSHPATATGATSGRSTTPATTTSTTTTPTSAQRGFRDHRAGHGGLPDERADPAARVQETARTRRSHATTTPTATTPTATTPTTRTPTTTTPATTTPATPTSPPGQAAPLNIARVASSIKESVLQGRGISVTVSCPPYIPIEVGRTFTCTATAANGETTSFSVTVRSSEGTVTFTSE